MATSLRARRAAAMLVAVGVMLVGAAATSLSGPAAPARAAGTVIYDSIPVPLAGDYPSVGFEAEQLNELGGVVTLSQSEDSLVQDVTFTYTSSACEQGASELATCESTPGATFEVDITATIYEYESDGSVGLKLGSTFNTVDVPYRPSASPLCSGPNALPGVVGGWNDNGTCRDGLAFTYTFPFSPLMPRLPRFVIVTTSYSTESSGELPEGVPGPYNFLNVAMPADNPPTVGGNLLAFTNYVSSPSTGDMLEGQESATNTAPMVRITARDDDLGGSEPIPAPSSDPSLAATGSEQDVRAGGIGAALLLTGAVLLVRAIRRRPAAAE